MLRPLPPGTAFDPAQAYAVLNGKAYNSQYGWNAGGQFAIPPGAAIWIELLNCSPGLDTYAGWGRFASYEPIFGAAGSPRLWKWSGVMVHNTYALAKSAVPFQFASYHIYFGDAQTGAQAPYSNYGDTTVTLTWNADLPNPSVMLFGAEDQTNGARLSFLNCSEFDTNSQVVLNLRQTNGPFALDYSCPLAAVAVPATAMNGGPVHQPCRSRVEAGVAVRLPFRTCPGAIETLGGRRLSTTLHHDRGGDRGHEPTGVVRKSRLAGWGPLWRYSRPPCCRGPARTLLPRIPSVGHLN